MAYFSSSLDGQQVLQNSHDEPQKALRTVPIAGTLVTEIYDSILPTYPNDTTEVYTYKLGGLSGTTVATVTVTYTDNTKADIAGVEKIPYAN